MSFREYKRISSLVAAIVLLAAQALPCLSQAAPSRSGAAAGMPVHHHQWQGVSTNIPAVNNGSPPAHTHAGTAPVHPHNWQGLPTNSPAIINVPVHSVTHTWTMPVHQQHIWPGQLVNSQAINNLSAHPDRHGWAMPSHQHNWQGQPVNSQPTGNGNAGTHVAGSGFWHNLFPGSSTTGSNTTTGSRPWFAHHNLNNAVGANNSNANSGFQKLTHDHSTRLWVNVASGSGGSLPSMNLDLSSNSSTLTAGHLLHNGTVTIIVGGNSFVVNSKTELTAAEYLAVKQVASGSEQSLVLDAQGSASGGTFIINPHMSQMISSLVIPQGVTVIDLTRSGTLNLTGNITDAGSLYVTSLNQALNTITISANNIFVQSQGLLSNVLPSGLLSWGTGSSSTALNLALNTTGNISNAGTISSSGNLSLNAGGSLTNALSGSAGYQAGSANLAPTIQAAKDINIYAGSGSITNAGLVNAAQGNVNIAAPATQNLTFNNVGGTVQAKNGDINLRDMSYAGGANSTLSGGNLLSLNLNIYAGKTGTADIAVNQLTGVVNEYGNAAHLKASTGTLRLGAIDLTGDPTFFNDSGSIQINDNISVGEALTIAASGSITTTVTSLSINTNSDGTLAGGSDINLIAGAVINGNSQTPSTFVPTGGTPTTGDITISNPTTTHTGGNIDLTGATGGLTIDASGTSTGGRINLIAYGDTGISGANTGVNGQVLLPANSTLGNAVNPSSTTVALSVIAGGSGTSAIQLGNANFKGGGSVLISNSQPNAGIGITAHSDGSLSAQFTEGSSNLAGGGPISGTASTGNIDTHIASVLAVGNAGSVTIKASGGINTVNINASNYGAGAAGAVSLSSSAGSVSTQDIDTGVYSAQGVSNAGDVTILAYGPLSSGSIYTRNYGLTGQSGSVTLTSNAGSITAGNIDTRIDNSASVGNAGNVTILACGASGSGFINVAGGSINTTAAGTGRAGAVSLFSSNEWINVDGSIKTYVQNVSSLSSAGNVTLSAFDSIGLGQGISTYNYGRGAGGTVKLASSGGAITASDIISYSQYGAGGDVDISASGTISLAGRINTGCNNCDPLPYPNLTTYASAGSVTLASVSSSVTTEDINTLVNLGGVGTAGSVTISAAGAIFVGNINAYNYSTGAAGSVAMVSADKIKTGSISTKGVNAGVSGTVYLSSGYSGIGAIQTGDITLGGGALLATAATSGSVTVQPFTDGNALGVNSQEIYATGTYSGSVTVLPQSFLDGSSTITPASIPGGGFTFFANTSTVTLADDRTSGTPVVTFSNLVPIAVQGVIGDLSTITDSTSSGRANLNLIARTMTTISPTNVSVGGGISVFANSMNFGNVVNTNGSNLSLKALQGITTAKINSANSAGTAAGSVTLSSSVGNISTGEIDTFISSASGVGNAGNVTISALGPVAVGNIYANNAGHGAGGTVTLESVSSQASTAEIDTYNGNFAGTGAAGNVTISAYSYIDTNGGGINTRNTGTGAGGAVSLTSNNSYVSTGTISTYNNKTGATTGAAGNVTISCPGSIVTGYILAYNSGSGAGGTVTLSSSAGTVSTDEIDTYNNNLASNGEAGNVTISAYGAITTNGNYINSYNNGLAGDGGSVKLTSANSTVSVGGEIVTNVLNGSGAAGNVTISAYGNINGMIILANNRGTGAGGTVALKSTTGSFSGNEIDTYANGPRTAGNVTISTAGGITLTNSVGTGAIYAFDWAGVAGGNVTLSSSNGTVSVREIDTYVNSGSGRAGNISISALSGITTNNSSIDAHNSGTGAGGSVTLISTNGTFDSGKIDTSVTSGANAAGDVTVYANGAVTTGQIITRNSGTGAAGSIDIVSGGAIFAAQINAGASSADLGGSIYLSSASSSAGAILVLTAFGRALLATAATSGSIAVKPFPLGSPLSVSSGDIFSSGTFSSQVTILPQNYSNSVSATITPASIPGGGFRTFNNTGTVTLADDNTSSNPVVTFANLVPVAVAGTVASVGTIQDGTSSGTANFTMIAQSVQTSGNAIYVNVGGGISLLTDQVMTRGGSITLNAGGSVLTPALNTSPSSGAGTVNITSAAGNISTGSITATGTTAGDITLTVASGKLITANPAGSDLSYSGGNITLNGDLQLKANTTADSFNIFATGAVLTKVINTSIDSGLTSPAGNVYIIASGNITINTGGSFCINASNSGAGAGGSVSLTSYNGYVSTGGTAGIKTAASSGKAGNVTILANGSVNTNSGNIYAYTNNSGVGGTVTLSSSTSTVYTQEIQSGSASASGNVTIAAHDNIGCVHIQTSGSGNGTGGTVAASSSNGSFAAFEIDATANGSGQAGNVNISTLGSITLTGYGVGTTSINTYDWNGPGAGGAVTLTSSGSYVSTQRINTFVNGGSGAAGNVTISSLGNINMNGYDINASSSSAGGTVNLKSTAGYISTANIYTNNASAAAGAQGAGGDVIIAASGPVSSGGYIKVQGVITTSNGGNGIGGKVDLTSSHDYVQTEAINTNVAGSTLTAVPAGLVHIQASSAITAGAINASNNGLGAGGTITLTSSNGSVSTGNILSQNALAGTVGAAGNVSITASGPVSAGGFVKVLGGITLSSNGGGGTVSLTSSNDYVSVSSNIITTAGSGSTAAAGNVTVNAAGYINTNSIDSSNSGTGAGGTVSLRSTGGYVSTKNISTNNSYTAAQGDGGNVTIISAGPTSLDGYINVQGGINTSNSGNGAGGKVKLDATNGNITTTGDIVTAVSGSPVTAVAAGDVDISGINISISNVDAHNNGAGAGGAIGVWTKEGWLTTGNLYSQNSGVSPTGAGGIVSVWSTGPANSGYVRVQGVIDTSGQGGGGIVYLLSRNDYVNASGSIKTLSAGPAAAGTVTVLAAGKIDTSLIDASNSGTGAGGKTTLSSTAGYVSTGAINTSNGSATTGANGAGGDVSVSASGTAGSGYINVQGAINTASYFGGGNVNLISSHDYVTVSGIIQTSAALQANSSAGNVNIGAAGALTTSSIDASNSSSRNGGTVTLSSTASYVSTGSIFTSNKYAGFAVGAAGDVIITAYGLAGAGINVGGIIDASTTGAGSGGSIALVTPAKINTGAIATSGAASVYLSSGYPSSSGSDYAITTRSITGGTGALYAITASNSASTSVLFPNSITTFVGGALSMTGGDVNPSSASRGLASITTTGSYTSVNVLPGAFSNSSTATITPSRIPGGGFTSFSNTGTLTLANDTSTGSGNVITFSNLTPFVVQNAVTALGAITDNSTLGSIGANFLLMAPSVDLSSTTTYQSTGGRFNIIAGNQISTSAIITTGVNVSLTGAQNTTVQQIDTTNGGAYPGASVCILSRVGSVSAGKIDTYVTSGSAAAGNVIISANNSMNSIINMNGNVIDAHNNGTGAGGNVTLLAGGVLTGEIDTFSSGISAVGNAGSIFISASSAVIVDGAISACNACNRPGAGGTGAGGNVTLTASLGFVSTQEIYTFAGMGNGGNVSITSANSLDTNGKIINTASASTGTGRGGSVALFAGTTFSGGEIDTFVLGGRGAAGNVIVSAWDSINTSSINTTSAGTGAGGAVTLLSSKGAVTTASINTCNNKLSGPGAAGGSIIVAAGGNDGANSILLGALTTSGSSAGSVEVVSLDSGARSVSVGNIEAKAAGQTGVGGSVGIATLGALSVGNINTTNISTGTSTGQSGSVFLSSANSITVGSGTGTITAYNAANSSLTGQVILVSTGAIAIPSGNITIGPGANKLVSAAYTSNTTSISSSATIQISTAGLSENYNPQGYTSISNSTSTTLRMDTGGNSLLLAPVLCTGAISVYRLQSNLSTSADGIALAALGNIAVGAEGASTSGSTRSGNLSLLSLQGAFTTAGPLSTSIASGAGNAGNVTILAYDKIDGNSYGIYAYNIGTGYGGSVTLTSGNGSDSTKVGTGHVLIGTIDTHAAGGAGGNVTITALGSIDSNRNPIRATSAATGTSGSVTLLSCGGYVWTGAIQTDNYGPTGQAGDISTTASGSTGSGGYISVSGNISARNDGRGAGGNVNLTSSNDYVSLTGSIQTYISGGLAGAAAAGNVTINAAGDINTGGNDIYTSNAGTGSAGSITLLSSAGSVTTGSIYTNLSSPSRPSTGVCGNVTISAFGNILTSAIQSDSQIASGVGTGGTVTLTSSNGIVATGNIITAVAYQNNLGFTGTGAAGNVTILSRSSINTGDIIARNEGTGNGGSVTLTSTKSSVSLTGIDVSVLSPSGPGSAGNISISSSDYIQAGGDLNASNFGTGAGGNITVRDGNATDTLYICSLPVSNNWIKGSIDAHSELQNGGHITLQTASSVVVSNNISADGAGNGGIILFTYLTPGAGPVSVENNADITATGTSGIVGFNGGAANAVTLSGSGMIEASQINFGNLNPDTAQILNPFIVVSPFTGHFQLGKITIDQGVLAGTIQVTGAITPPSPIPPPVNSGSLSLSEFLSWLISSGLWQSEQLSEQILLNEQIGTRIATDYTPWTTYPMQPLFNQVQLQGGISVEQLASAGESLFIAGSFNAAELNALAGEGIAFGPNSNGGFLDLQKGYVLFMPTSDISVQTREGLVVIPRGTIAWVMETGNDVAVYDLHDDLRTGSIKVITNGKEMALAPGTQVLLSRNGKANFESLNPGNAIAYRNVKVSDMGAGVKAYVCDFSIVHGLSNVPVIRRLLVSGDPAQRRAAWKLIKNAAILADLTGVNYKTPPAGTH